MANADFNPKQTGTPGGFDAGSYREKASPEQTVQLTPLQQKLAGLEKALDSQLAGTKKLTVSITDTTSSAPRSSTPTSLPSISCLM